ncbi:hypothetical protein BXZ70DRAFT_1061614 [Cristinia sonorae]|uniref:Peptidase S54 rhomboid domain-containing protein n=1 Tax=Cristinia sonorae TaxID=1940300 RepID=A0A8K0UWB1_9AGAR|nr:hypothetical protein BXZ70DRAFT_1061614 [Cristinia sonorae]
MQPLHPAPTRPRSLIALLGFPGISLPELLTMPNRRPLSYFNSAYQPLSEFPVSSLRHSSSSITRFIHSKILQETYRHRIPIRTNITRQGGGWGRSNGPGGPFRRAFDSIPGQVIVGAIVGINILVFIAWYVAGANARLGNPSLWKTMRQHLIRSHENIRAGRYWTFVTSIFSHQELWHIAVNSIAIWSIAPMIVSVLGNTRFIAFYLISGVMGNAFSYLWHQYGRHDPTYSSNGASGSMNGVIALVAAWYPTTTFLFFFVVPAPAWLLVGGVAAYDAYSTFITKRPPLNIDGAAHLGGLFTGFAYVLAKRFRIL